jgi:hypothetical protein
MLCVIQTVRWAHSSQQVLACTSSQWQGRLQGCKETHFELTTRCTETFFTMSDSLQATNFHKRGLVGILQNYHCPLHQSQDSYNLVFRGIQLSGKKKNLLASHFCHAEVKMWKFFLDTSFSKSSK